MLMKMNDIVINSVKYASSNWLKLVLIGLVVFIADLSDVTIRVGSFDLSYILLGAGFILGIYQIGFIFRIIEETTHGFDEMPKFDNFLNTFLHGIKETLVTMIYFIIPIMLVIIGVYIVDDLIGSSSQELEIVMITFGIFLASITFLIYQASILNMANNHGSIKSAFDFKRIFKKVKDIGFKRTGFMYLLIVVLVLIVKSTLHDTVVNNPFDLWSIISALVVIPFILIFTARVLGLINRALDR